MRVLGQGGFGITYRAVDTKLDREVAIKEYLPISFAVRRPDFSVLPRSTQVAEDFRWGRERFLAEARTLARLTDAPGVVDVFDYLEAYGTAYMVMALVQGETLDARLKREGRLPQLVVDQLLYPLLDGLEQVHEAGFLHRDIKPENILMDPLGRPTLIDFGASREALQGRFKALTAVYTPGYAAFEQVASGDQGPWTDIYALSATLYHSITGRRPPSAIERMAADTLVPAVEAGKGIYSRGLLAAIDAGLSLRAADRPQSIADWRRMLSDGAPSARAPLVRPPVPYSEPTVKADAPRGKRRSRLWLAAAAVLVVCLASAGAYVVFFRPVESAEDAARRAEQEAQRQAELAVRLRQQEEARKAAEQDRVRREEEARKAADEKSKAEKAEAERRAAEAERARAAEESRRKAEADRLAAAEAQRKAEQQRQADEEAKRRTAEERARQEAETARIEADRKAAEAARTRQEEEARRKGEQERLTAEEAIRRQEEQERQARAEAQRKAEEERQAAEAAQRRAEEERRKRDAEQARIEAEQAAAADAQRKAEADAKARAEREKAEQDARQKREEEAALRAAEEKARVEAAAREKAEADARLKADAEARRQAEAAETALKLSDIDRRRIQVALSALGFDTQGTDGVFGPRTRQMVMGWQKRQGYPETGFITAPQLAALREQAAPALAKFDEEQKRREDALRATPPPGAAGSKTAAERCRAITARAEIGEPLSPAELALLRSGCRG